MSQNASHKCKKYLILQHLFFFFFEWSHFATSNIVIMQMDGSNAGKMTERTYAVADRGKGNLIIMLWHLQLFLCLKDQHEMPRHWYSSCHFDLLQEFENSVKLDQMCSWLFLKALKNNQHNYVRRQILNDRTRRMERLMKTLKEVVGTDMMDCQVIEKVTLNRIE